MSSSETRAAVTRDNSVHRKMKAAFSAKRHRSALRQIGRDAAPAACQYDCRSEELRTHREVQPPRGNVRGVGAFGGEARPFGSTNGYGVGWQDRLSIVC